MSPSDKGKGIKLVSYELNIFLIASMGTFGWFKGKNIKFNPRPFTEKRQTRTVEKNTVDFHVEITKKIDALVEAHEKEVVFEEVGSTSQGETLEEIAEQRKPVKRKPEMPRIATEIPTPHVFNNLEAKNELFDIELPSAISPNFKFVTTLEEPKDGTHTQNIGQEPVKDEDFHSWMLGGHKEKQKLAMNFANIKVRKKEDITKQKEIKSNDKHKKNDKTSAVKKKKTIKINSVTKKKKEPEKTKKEIEERKKEFANYILETAEKKEREKEKELKKKKIEKQKEEKEEGKLKTLEQKKAAKGAKMKEREMMKKARITEKKKKLEAKKALKEEKLNKKTLKKKVAKPKKEKIKTKHSTPGMHHFISGKKETVVENPLLDEDIKKVLSITDNLLEKLPEEVIDKFAQSEDFELYEKVMSKYKIK